MEVEATSHNQGMYIAPTTYQNNLPIYFLVHQTSAPQQAVDTGMQITDNLSHYGTSQLPPVNHIAPQLQYNRLINQFQGLMTFCHNIFQSCTSSGHQPP